MERSSFLRERHLAKGNAGDTWCMPLAAIETLPGLPIEVVIRRQNATCAMCLERFDTMHALKAPTGAVALQHDPNADPRNVKAICVECGTAMMIAEPVDRAPVCAGCFDWEAHAASQPKQSHLSLIPDEESSWCECGHNPNTVTVEGRMICPRCMRPVL
jgi:hypothetical protein